MQTEAYERIRMTITEFETEDVITTSGGDKPVTPTDPEPIPGEYEGGIYSTWW